MPGWERTCAGSKTALEHEVHDIIGVLRCTAPQDRARCFTAQPAWAAGFLSVTESLGSGSRRAWPGLRSGVNLSALHFSWGQPQYKVAGPHGCGRSVAERH